MEAAAEISNEEEDLIMRIENEMRKIYNSVEKLYNNCFFSETQDPLEKCLISIYSYSSCLTEKGNDECVLTNEDPLKELDESLQRELDCLFSDMDITLKKVNTRKEKINSVDRNITNLQAMMEGHKNEVTKPKTGIDIIMKNIKQRFRKEKADLKAIINKLFADNMDVQDLIARVLEHHLAEGADKYLQLESDEMTEYIELLNRIGLCDINPHDPLQIRLANLL